MIISESLIAFSSVNDSITMVETLLSSKSTYEPRGPFVNSEFYPGWIDHWSVPHARVPGAWVARTMDEMLAIKASFTV